MRIGSFDPFVSRGSVRSIPTLARMDDSLLLLDETVTFEVPEQTDATALRELLRRSWVCSLVFSETSWVVYVDLERAVFYAEDDRYLVERDLRVRHYEVDVTPP